MIGSLTTLALLQSVSPPIAVVRSEYETAGEFSCQLHDSRRKFFEVSGKIVDYSNGGGDAKDRITIEFTAPNKTGLSGTYFGYVNGEAFILRNVVDHDSHLVSGVDRAANLLLWGTSKTGGTLSVIAGRDKDKALPSENFSGLCEINFRKERVQ